MEEVTVGPKYQIVIPKKIRRKLGIKPGDKVVYSQIRDGARIKMSSKSSWVEQTRGMMKEAWKDTDTTQYLKDLRDEWDKKP